nr:MAG TPA: hypothetical protein [Caudoviricetes sp.]
MKTGLYPEENLEKVGTRLKLTFVKLRKRRYRTGITFSHTYDRFYQVSIFTYSSA